jgi:hypothetical protein
MMASDWIGPCDLGHILSDLGEHIASVEVIDRDAVDVWAELLDQRTRVFAAREHQRGFAPFVKLQRREVDGRSCTHLPSQPAPCFGR